MKTKQQVQSLAESKFMCYPNDDNDIGIREHNQRMWDKQQAFIEGYFTDREPIIFGDVKDYLGGEFFLNEPAKKSLIKIIAQLEHCNYITEDSLHELKNNAAFIALKQLTSD